MPMSVHILRRADLSPNGVVAFEAYGLRCLVADVDGEVHAFAVTGPSASALARAAIADDRLRCPRHGWPIDLREGRCGAADACRYQTLPVEVGPEEIRVTLPGP
jgi:nitrite reductase/ring-hydroxylating ferredoxin subunit